MVSALFVAINQSSAQGSRFFRVSGPAATTITALNADGTLVWSNTMAGTNYIVQTVSSLPGGTNWVDYVQLPVTSSVNTNLIVSFNPPAGMALIPAGSIIMGDTLDGGSPDNDDYPTNIYVSAFYMDVNLVTSNLWAEVYGYATNHGYIFDPGPPPVSNDLPQPAARAANYPVESVDWYNAVAWCNARSQQTGLTPVYYTDAGLTLIYTNRNDTNVVANWSADGYRLPTEAEWEKAARGGLIGQRFPWGNTITETQANYFSFFLDTYDLGPYGGFNTNFDGGIPWTDQVTFTNDNSSPVGFFAPNGYGIYDMAGNVFEWCWDWYATPYGQPTTNNPTGPVTGSYRVLRGGNWINHALNARCAFRTDSAPTTIYVGVGFRSVRGF